MKFLALLSLLVAPAALALDFSAGSPVAVTPEASTGLEAVYVLESTAGVTVSYPYSGAAPVWYRYSNLGGAYAEEIASTAADGVSSVTLAAGDMGYIVEHGGRQHCYWVTDYSAHALDLQSLTVATPDDCSRQRLDFTGHAAEIPYYSINGRRMELSRELEVAYTTLVFDEETFAFSPASTVETLAHIGEFATVDAPLCATDFTLSGDRFLKAWNREQSITTATMQPYAVEARTRATQELREVDNEQKVETGSLGGSAPCIVFFESALTDAAVFHEWQLSRSPEFEINDLTYTETEFTYTFNENGTTYVRLVAANSDGSCEYVSDVYEVFVGESRLDIPNAFSPQNQDGVNDLWKVSYKSIISFECHIFNRWGQQLYSSSDPSQGWDGKHGGKFVPAGVYYYVIKAEGADGVRYDRAGDINIVGYSQSAVSSAETTE